MNTLRGLGSLLALSLNTLLWGTTLLGFAVVKLLVPANVVRRPVDRILNRIVELWVAGNDALLGDVVVEATGVDGLHRDRWYLVSANHQSWADIFVLQKVLTKRIPLLKFFLKRELIWIPVIGLAWWALDFPFMKRHSQDYLRRHPERRADDLAAIRRACEKFSLIPTAVTNFVEGTRFTPEKQNAGGSPYRHLLAPKAGGIALALNAMGERFHSLLDVTIFYPDGAPTFFGMLAGRMRHVVVEVREVAIPSDLVRGDYASDPDYRARVNEWLRRIWKEKDARMEALRAQYAR